jgi:hypothetical protein
MWWYVEMAMDGKQPARADVIIAPDRASSCGFTLSIAPDGPPQLWYASWEEAVSRAFAWASESGVAVWRADSGAKFVSVPHLVSESSTLPRRQP